MRLLALYLRSRQVPVALPVAAAGVAAVAVLGDNPGRPAQSVTFALLALALGAGVLGVGLGGAHVVLERTAAIRWAGWRAAHVLAVAAVLFAVGAAASSAPAGVVLRDAAGLVGLTALAAVAFGSQLAWTLPVAWAGAAAAVPALSGPVILRVLTWPSQPPQSTTATVTAAVLACAGLLAYAVRGGRPSAADRSGHARAPKR
jgi:hypothetical protein